MIPHRHLPGLHWDDVQQRYFASQKPTQPPPQPQPQPQPLDSRVLTPYRALSDLRSVCRYVHKEALIHHIRSSQISLTNKTDRSIIPLHGLVSAFQTVSHQGRLSAFAGDTFGWLYSSALESGSIDRWQSLYNLSSEVSSIAVSPTSCIATSFGPQCRILYLPLNSPEQEIHVSRIDSRVVHDVWTTDLHGSRLVLGANKQAVIINDIAVNTSLYHLPTRSDVFALAQREHILYTGLRSGDIIRFDTRDRNPQSHSLFDGMLQRQCSVTGLKHLRDHQLVVSFINGRLSAFDLRFPFRTPSMDFTGNVNAYTTRLPLVTDPHERYLFAAGQDNRIRLWSLTTGGPALGTRSMHQSAFERPFEHRVAALQVAEEKDGMCLWAASGTELFKYSLGHRSEMGTQDMLQVPERHGKKYDH